MTLPALPRQSQPMVGAGGLATVPWYDLLARVHAQIGTDNSDLAAQVAALAAQMADLEGGELLGLSSVQVTGSLADGQAVVQLVSDQLAPGNNYFYGTDSSGAKAWISSALAEVRGTAIASAATTDIGAAAGNFVHVTGTTTITALGTVQAGTRRVVTFDGALTLTHNATSLILPSGANITTAANDCAAFISEGSGNWRCVAYQKANGQAVAGGLVSWTEAVSTAAPNASVPVVSFTATNAAANVDAAIVAKGTGATTAQVADNTTTGGDKRGTRATDWQKVRSNSPEVASGPMSTIGGGERNKATQNYATIAGGYAGLASGQYAAIAGGASNTASASNTFIGSGDTNTASALYAAVIGGTVATASGTSSLAHGTSVTANGDYSVAFGQQVTANSLRGHAVYGSGQFSQAGDAQRGVMVLRVNTTNATQATATSDGSTASTTNQVVLRNASSFVVKGTINAWENATTDCKSWDFTAHIKRGANAAATAMVAACTPTAIAAAAGAAAWAVAVDADTTNGCLRIRVTGEAAKSIRWVVDLYSINQVAG
jgi:hypothetical protein